MFATTVYILCGLTSLLCAVLLFHSSKGQRNTMAFNTALAFCFFTLNNFLVVLDFIIWPHMDLVLVRQFILFIGVSILVYGLVWETA